MIRYVVVAFLLALSMPLQAAEEMILLDFSIAVDGEVVSEPRLAMKPGSDASLMQGLEDGEGLKMSFHSLHASESGVNMLVDIDLLAGADDRSGEHYRSEHREFAWGETSEFVFGFDNGQDVTVTLTPSRTTREALEK